MSSPCIYQDFHGVYRCCDCLGKGGQYNGVTANFSFSDTGTFWVLPLTCFYLPKSARAYVCLPNLSKFITFAAAPLVLTSFVRNQFCPFEEPKKPLGYGYGQSKAKAATILLLLLLLLIMMMTMIIIIILTILNHNSDNNDTTRPPRKARAAATAAPERIRRRAAHRWEAL